MSEAPMTIDDRVFGAGFKRCPYTDLPYENGIGASSLNQQSIANLRKLKGNLVTLQQRQKCQARTLATVQAEHVTQIDAAELIVATREQKPRNMVTQAEIEAQLEATMDPTHALIHQTRLRDVYAQEAANMAAKIAAATEAMQADGILPKPPAALAAAKAAS